MSDQIAQIIGIVETSPLPEERKALYREMLTKEGASATAIVEAIKSDLRNVIDQNFVAAGGELDPNDPELKKVQDETEQAMKSVQQRYIATMKDLEERVDKVMNDAESQIDKLNATLAKEELTA